SIPRNVIDAAKVDGAGFFRQLFKINLPIVLPIVTVGLVFGTVFAFTDMSVIWLLTRGGPMNVTHVLATLAFQNGILSGDIGRGSAISVFLVPILGILVVMALRGIRREA
ncbi:MAG TPA: ABC transporter permease subunit, partial [Anaerolineales bacterium]|nr:ABC transporter permease subunit [Anaerolineales bacterium]